MRAATAALALVVGVGAVLPAAGSEVPTAPEGQLPPRPAEVRSVEVPPVEGTEGGEVAFEPAVAWLELRPGTAAQPEVLLANRSATPVAYRLAVTSVASGADGAPVPAGADADAGAVAPSAAPWVRLADERVHLDPGEVAHLFPTVEVPADVSAGAASYLAAIAAEPLRGDAGEDEGAAEEDVLAAVVVVTLDAPPDPGWHADAGLARTGPATAVAAVTVVGDAPVAGAFTGSLSVHSWYGRTIVAVPVPEHLVLPGTPREVEVEFRPPTVPGPYRVEAALDLRGGGTVAAQATVWLWNPVATAALAAVVLLALTVALLIRARRTRTG